MKKKMMMAVVAAVFLNASGAFADTMFSVGGTVFFDGEGALGFNGILPQVGYMSAKRDIRTRIATEWDEARGVMLKGYPITEFFGWDFNGFGYSILFDLTIGMGLSPLTLNLSSGLTAEFYFLPELWIFKIGAGIGGGWGFIGWNKALSTENDMPNPYGAPYIRATIPVLLGPFKTGVYFDYYFTDEPYTQFNIVFAMMF
jgi:hypothetical protein